MADDRPATAQHDFGDDPPPLREQVLEAVEGTGDAAILGTKVFLRHAARCRTGMPVCQVCTAILDACRV